MEKEKEEWLNIRIGSGLKRQIQEVVMQGDYKDMTHFVVKAIEEKLDPSRRKGIPREEIKEQIRQALKDDPSLLAEPLAGIALRFSLPK